MSCDQLLRQALQPVLSAGDQYEDGGSPSIEPEYALAMCPWKIWREKRNYIARAIYFTEIQDIPSNVNFACRQTH
jgi:hypothetical protein